MILPTAKRGGVERLNYSTASAKIQCLTGLERQAASARFGLSGLILSPEEGSLFGARIALSVNKPGRDDTKEKGRNHESNRETSEEKQENRAAKETRAQDAAHGRT